jgi:glycosyltransferase involved in cell wall biosynthesis
VRFLGFRSQSETWQMLGLSDLFLHAAALETWGLVINEAVAAGLPTLVTNECGAAEDLVSPGRTGEILSVGDVNGWADAIGRWARRALARDYDAPLLTELADRHSLDATACAFEAAVLTRPTLEHFTC